MLRYRIVAYQDETWYPPQLDSVCTTFLYRTALALPCVRRLYAKSKVSRNRHTEFTCGFFTPCAVYETAFFTCGSKDAAPTRDDNGSSFRLSLCVTNHTRILNTCIKELRCKRRDVRGASFLPLLLTCIWNYSRDQELMESLYSERGIWWKGHRRF